MKRYLIIGSIILVMVASLMGCCVGPGYGYRGYYGGYGGYPYYGYGYSGYFRGWGPRWFPGYVLRVCEDRSTGRVCYDTWVPPHYE